MGEDPGRRAMDEATRAQTRQVVEELARLRAKVAAILALIRQGSAG